MLHRGLVIAIVLAIELMIIGRAAAREVAREVRSTIISVSACVAVLLVLVASSYETARVALQVTDDPTVRQAAVSIWWGVFAIALLAIGFAWRWRSVRQAGLLLLGVATVKALVFDLQNVALGWRVISVLALGLLMLAVGVVYARLSKSLDEANGEDSSVKLTE